MSLSIIKELRENYSILTLHGTKEIYIENFISVAELTSETARIKAVGEIITIEGEKLQIEYLNKSDLKISGVLKYIRLMDTEGNTL